MTVRVEEPQRGEHEVGVELGAEVRGLLQHRGTRAATIGQLDLDGLQPRPRLLDVSRFALTTNVRHGHGRAERRMPRERQLASGHPDPVAVVGAGLGGGLDEGRLRQLRLAREDEHGLVGDVVGVVHDGESVSRQRARREDVEPRQAVGH